MQQDDEFEPILRRLSQDMAKASQDLKAEQARYLVDTYYNLQKLRIAASAQVRSSEAEPNQAIVWSKDMYGRLEARVQSMLLHYAKSQVVGRWSLAQLGIGPVIAAGLLAHIPIEKTPTAGALWRYAGLDPTQKWEKKTKRPWNATLKVLCWKAGQSFVKTCNHPESYYGKLYSERKAWELVRNNLEVIPGSDPVKYRPINPGLPGAYSEQARAALSEKKYNTGTEAYSWYSQGILPPAQIQARAERYAVKIFLSHWHAVAYEVHYGKPSPLPWIIAYDPKHTHLLQPPGWPLITTSEVRIKESV